MIWQNDRGGRAWGRGEPSDELKCSGKALSQKNYELEVCWKTSDITIGSEDLITSFKTDSVLP